MKIKNLVGISSILAASLLGAQAATTLTAWNFDNIAIGASSSPSPSTGFGVANAIGLGVSSNPDVQSLAGSSSGLANSWRVRGTSPIGWSTNAAIGTQGARFSASTAGYYQIKATFDVYATTDAEAYLQVQYTTEGTIWHNATVTSAGTPGYIANNLSTNNSLVVGSYLVLTNSGPAGWNNGVTVDLTGVSGVDNNPNFAIRIVNAATGTNCLTTTGAPYNNTSGDWTFDNVVIQGTAIDTIADWTFESYGTTGFVPHPVPELNFSLFTYATALGFDNNYTYAGSSTPGSTNAPDTLVQGGSSTPTGTICWRVRGAGPNNGWNTAAPIGAQGAEFDASTVNYSNVVINFDLYFTTQGEAKMCVLYTTNNWATTNVANNLYYAANPTFIVTNDVNDLANYSPNTVAGTYFYQTTGQNFYNNLLVDFTGVPGVDNNPNFGIRIVNAATGSDCVAFNGGPYNNSSGNCRFDNVTIGGKFEGLTPPAVNYATSATVDAPFTNTFVDDAAWRAAITTIYVNGSAVTNAAYTTTISGQIVFNPTNSILLQSSGVKTIVITATGYSAVKVTQPLGAGVAKTLSIANQPVAPSASGGTLVVNPVLVVADKYGNGTTNPYASVSVTASVSNSVAWTLGGDTNQTSINGVIAFTNLTATVSGSSAVSGAAIKFTISGYPPATVTNSVNFTIGAPAASFTQGNLAILQLDSAANANNTTFSIIEVKPSTANQTSPANIIPISATGTNALRLSNAGSCGKLSLSDDGTLACFAAFADGSAATLDETLILSRAAAGLNYTNQFNLGLNYNSVSLGGSQARSCATLDNVNWIVDDKGGLYYGAAGANLAFPNLNAYNNVVVRTFGGVPYVETQKTANGQVIPVVYALGFDNDTGLYDVTKANNLNTDPVASDFYMISTNGGSSYDILYVLDGVSSSLGIINKYSRNNDGVNWNYSGSFTNGTGGDSLFATTNGTGGVYLYYSTTAVSKTAGNFVYRLTDAAGYGANISITSSNLIYTAPTNTFVKGITFAPKPSASSAFLIPTPLLTGQTFAATNATFSITNTPDDPFWRTNITLITVNGSPLSRAAYNTNQVGKIVFDPSQDPLLQTPGSKVIVISAAGYSTNSITQLVAGVAAKLAVTTQPKAPLGSGGVLATQPVVSVQDAFGNTVASTASIVAQVGAGSWTLGGTTSKTASSGVATFSGLTAFGTNAVTGATISFTASGLTGATSSTFNIPAPIQSILGAASLSAGKLTFTFTNITGLSYSVLSTNNLTALKSTWPVIGTAVEGPAGTYKYTNSVPATNGPQFYLLRQP